MISLPLLIYAVSTGVSLAATIHGLMGVDGYGRNRHYPVDSFVFVCTAGFFCFPVINTIIAVCFVAYHVAYYLFPEEKDKT